MFQEVLLNPQKPDDIEAAYEAKTAIDCLDEDISQIKNIEEKKKAKELLSHYVSLCEKYVETIYATELIKEHQPKDLETHLLNLEKQRKDLHNQIKDTLKELTRIIIDHNGHEGKWIDYVKNNSLSQNRERISWLAICTAKWQELQNRLNQSTIH